MGKTNIWLQLRDAVNAIDDAWLRAFLFGHLGQIWPEAGQRIFWSDALTALEKVPDETERSTLLARFAPRLPNNLYDRAVCLIEKVVWDRNRTQLLLAYAAYLSPDKKAAALAELLETLVNLPPGPETADQLSRLIPFLSETQRMEAVETIQGQPGLWNQAQKIRPFLPFLRTQDRQTVVSQIIFRCRRLESAERYRVLAEVALYLPEPKLRELIDGFRELDDDTSRIAVLERTAEVLPEAQMAWVWDGIQSIWNKNRRAWLICHLYNWLPINRQPVALSEIRNTLNLSVERDTLLLSIRDEVPHVLLLEVLELAAETQEAVRVKILDGLLAQMSGEILADGLEVALNIGRSDLRYARLEMLDRLSERLVGWASDSPEDAGRTWQMLFARRKGEVQSNSENGDNGQRAKTAVSRAELLVDLAGLLPFFLLFIPTNHQPGVAIQLIEEMRRLVTGPKLMTVGRKVEQQLIG
jgi:hypothetical protein